MTAVLVLGFLVLLALWAIGMGMSWHRIDVLERRNEDLERHLAKANSDFADAVEKANEAFDHARDWAAVADERAMDLVEHRHRCLGEMVPNDSGVVR